VFDGHAGTAIEVYKLDEIGAIPLRLQIGVLGMVN